MELAAQAKRGAVVDVDLPQPRTSSTREQPRFFELVTQVRENLAAAGAPIFFLLLLFLAARERFQTA